MGNWGADPNGAPLVSPQTSPGRHSHVTALEKESASFNYRLTLFLLSFAASGRFSRIGLHVLLRPLENWPSKGNGKASWGRILQEFGWRSKLEASTAL